MANDKVKAKLQELCPDVYLGGLPETELQHSRIETITLAVVLRAIDAIENDTSVLVNRDGEFATHYITDIAPTWQHVFWNLEHDNYDQQSEECKQFIGSLLGV